MYEMSKPGKSTESKRKFISGCQGLKGGGMEMWPLTDRGLLSEVMKLELDGSKAAPPC